MYSFSKKTKIIFSIFAILCFISAIVSLAFFSFNVQEKLIAFGDKLMHKTLNRENWHTVISLRAKCCFIMFIVLSAGFTLLNFVQFEENSNFTLSFRLHFCKLEKNYKIGAVIVLLLITFTSFYWINKKDQYQIDELYQIGIINRNEYGFWHGTYPDTLKPHTGKEIKEFTFFDDSSVKDCLKDIAHLYFHINDNPHTGLFCITQRLFMIGSHAHTNKAVIIRLFLFNFLNVLLSFYFMLLILKKLQADTFTSMLVLLASFMNLFTLDISFFFRPNIQQQLFFLVFGYVFISFYKAIDEDKLILNKKNLLAGSLCLGLSLLSEYTSLFFVAISGLFIIIKCITKNKQNYILFFVAMFFAGFIWAKIIYPDFGIGFFDERKGGNFIEKITSGFSFAINHINNGFISIYIFIVVIVLCSIFMLKNNKKNICSYLLLSSGLFFIFLSCIFSPMRGWTRYPAPGFVLLGLVIIPISFDKNKHTQILSKFFQCALVFIVISKTLPVKNNEKNFEHLHESFSEITNAEFKKDSTVPVVIDTLSTVGHIYPYISDKQIYYFADNYEDIKNIKFNSNNFWYIYYISERGGFHEELISIEKYNNN